MKLGVFIFILSLSSTAIIVGCGAADLESTAPTNSTVLITQSTPATPTPTPVPSATPTPTPIPTQITSLVGNWQMFQTNDPQYETTLNANNFIIFTFESNGNCAVYQEISGSFNATPLETCSYLTNTSGGIQTLTIYYFSGGTTTQVSYSYSLTTELTMTAKSNPLSYVFKYLANP